MGNGNQYRDDHQAARARIVALERELASAKEDRAELARLRQLLEKHGIDSDPAASNNSAPNPEQAPPRELQLFDADAPAPAPQPPTSAEASGRRWWAIRKTVAILLAPLWIVAALLKHVFVERTEFPRPVKATFLLFGVVAIISVAESIRDYRYRTQMNHQVAVTWDAVVQKSQGNVIDPGGSCVITAALVSNRRQAFGPIGLTVSCGGSEVYNWNADYAAIDSNPHQGCGTLRQKKSPEGAHRYQLSCVDVKGRIGGRPEMSLESSSKQMRIWRETPPLFRLELAVDAWSRPVEGPPLLEGTSGEVPNYW